MNLNGDLGAVLTLSGTALLSTYTFSSALAASRCQKLRVHVAVTGKSGTALTNVTVKVQGTYDGTHFSDLISNKDDTNTSQPMLEQVYSVPNGSTSYFSFNLDPRGFPGGIRIGAHADATGAAGDGVVVSVVMG